MDKIPNTRCFNCLCKVNGDDRAPRGRRSTTRVTRILNAMPRHVRNSFAFIRTCRTQKFFRISGDRWRERDASETAGETTT